jgi:hypothetical protein
MMPARLTRRKGLDSMSDLLTKLANAQASKQRPAKARREQADQERQRQFALGKAWQGFIRACELNGPAADATLTLGALLKAHGCNLPTMIAKRRKAKASNAELAVLELLRLATASEPSKAKITKAVEKVAAVEWPMGGLDEEADTIRDYFRKHNAHGILPPPPPRKKPTAPASLPAKSNQDGPWSEPDTPTRWAKRFKVKPKTFKRYVTNGKIRAKKLSDRSYQVNLADLPQSHLAQERVHN